MNRKLKSNADIPALLDRVNQCRGEVFLHTPYKDVLNLKSTLCRYIFAVLVAKGTLLGPCLLVFSDDADAALLCDFWEP